MANVMLSASKASPGGTRLLGAEKMKLKIAALAAKIPDAVGAALYAEALIEMAESMSRTPVDTGALRASHITKNPERSLGGTMLSVTIEVGGPSANYAIPVHEDLGAIHQTGQAKYLESTIKESAPFMASRIGARLSRTVKGL